jgi:hypothetical protein
MAKSLRFAIIRTFHLGKTEVVAEYNLDQIKDKLAVLVKDGLILALDQRDPPKGLFRKKPANDAWGWEEIREAVERAFTAIREEYDKETLRIP